MAEFATARVFLGDAFVGALAESSAGEITFEYDSTFAASGLEISPIQLPLARASAMSFPELRRKPAFLGLPGVFADALPDAFGNAIIQRYFEERGCAADALSPVQKLLYVGNRAMGALSFKPAHERGRGDDEVLEVQSLVEQARRVIEGDTTTAIPEIMQVGWWRSRKRTNPLGQDARAGAIGASGAATRGTVVDHQIRWRLQRVRRTRHGCDAKPRAMGTD